ncbi:MAG: hypothetical protein WC405_19265 [Syntrophales bacterium]|jgi:nitrate/nitrite-specific signal transduction histidine kinase|nr:hypothetical protein [Syntrophobacterales bacterium]
MKSKEYESRETTHDELAEALRDAHQEILDFQFKLAEYEWVESALRKRTRELNERVKELECLYSISNCLCRSDSDISEMLQDLVNIIPRGYQNPKRTWACLEVYDKSFYSSQFQTTPDSHSADIIAHGRRAGALTVWVLAKPDSDAEPLILPMERALLQTIALWIGKTMDIGVRPNQGKPQPSRWTRTLKAAAALLGRFKTGRHRVKDS